jgi:hypothetical protein
VRTLMAVSIPRSWPLPPSPSRWAQRQGYLVGLTGALQALGDDVARGVNAGVRITPRTLRPAEVLKKDTPWSLTFGNAQSCNAVAIFRG